MLAGELKLLTEHFYSNKMLRETLFALNVQIVVKNCSFDTKVAEVLKNNNQQISVVIISRYLNDHTLRFRRGFTLVYKILKPFLDREC